MSFHTVALVLTVALLASLGWVCVFKPLAVAQFAQRTYRGNRLTRAWPLWDFSRIVVKPWYPIYLRCMGIFMWAFAGLLVLALLTGNGE